MKSHSHDKIHPEQYETRHERTPRNSYLGAHWRPLIAAAISKYCKDKTVLDLGCGTGAYTTLIAESTNRVLGLDISRAMLNYAKNKHGNLDLALADGHHIPLKAESIDVVICIGMLDYTQREAVLEEINRVLKPNGICIIHSFNKYRAIAVPARVICKVRGREYLSSRKDLSYGETLRLSQQKGFKVIESRADDGLIYLPDFLDRLCGRGVYLLIEKFFRIFGRNPFTDTMLFVVRKEKKYEIGKEYAMLSRIYYKIEPRFPPVKVIKKLYYKMFAKEPRRYKYLFETIRKNKCRKIMEIGTWNGEHALRMIEEAKKNFPPGEIQYYGFDLFELLDDKMASKEFSTSKIPPSLEIVREKLAKTNAEIHLYKGDTRNTLPKVVNELPKVDFVFIDGGHSIEAIQNDWKYVQKFMDEKTIVIFDDYWNRDDAGCKKVVEGIDKTKFEVRILPIQDKFKKEWGILKINFVQVKKRIS